MLSAKIEAFGRLLRNSGVRVSTAEILDAVRAVDAIGVQDGASVRAALAATLVKRAADLPVFHELFGLYFRRHALLPGGSESEAGAAVAALVDQAIEAAAHDVNAGERAGELTHALLDGAMALSAVGRMGMGLRAPEIAALVQAAGAEIALDDMRSPLQVGFNAYRLGEALGVAQAEADALAMADAALVRAGLAHDAVRAAIRAEILARFGQLRQALRAHVRQAFALQHRDLLRDLALDALEHRPLAQLSEREIAELRHEIVRLAQRLRARLARRPRRTRRGYLDLGRTLRRSLTTGGVPFELRHRHRRRHRPRLLVLCDISDSVRTVSRFMLQLVYTLQELFDRVQTFAFVADIGELTALFRQHTLERALELTYAGAVVSTFASSNYGRTFEQLVTRHLDRVGPRTTILVIGDGRTNHHPCRADLVRELRRRARHLLWINPEPPALWGLGDSAMRAYEPCCDRVMVVRDLRGLRKVIDHLVM